MFSADSCHMTFTAFVVWSVYFVGVFGQTTRPNILIILADDLGWDDVSFHGSQQIPTPNLDALAYDGIILGNYYVQPLCTPSRAALMTGRYPIRYGLQQGVIISAQPYGLPLSETLLPQYLSKFGYASHIVGKWHLGFYMNESTPVQRGFDSHYGYYQGCGDYFDHTYVSSYPSNKAWGFDFRHNMDLLPLTYGQYSTELYTAEAERIISEHDTSKPLFLYMPHQAVHSGNPVTPLEAPEKYIHRMSHIKSNTRRLYAAMLSALDDSVGNVTQALHQRGMLNNTIIIFSTDNGGPADGYNMNDASNWPLRGLKSTVWEGGTRGAGFIWSPRFQKSQYISHELVHITDWLPTLMHSVTTDSDNFQLPSNIDGIDQWDMLSGGTTSKRSELLYNIDPAANASALRVGEMKLLFASRGSTRQFDKWYPTDEGRRTEDGSVLQEPFFSDPNHDSIELAYSDMNIQMDYPRPKIADHRSDHIYGDDNRPDFLSEVALPSQSSITGILRELGRSPGKFNQHPLVVKCGPPPANASTNCKPWLKACLFNVTSDPCEYHNLADERPDVVQTLQKRLEMYIRQSAKPLNKPTDDAGLPYHHHWNWVPWVKSAGRLEDTLRL